eukprot:7729489-Pyramimonas_sp.AAC.1
MATFACVRVAHFHTPLTRFVASQGAPAKAPMATFACARVAHFRTPPYTIRGPTRSSTECPSDCVRMRPRRTFRRPSN